jgi:hypothetical protein
VNLNLKNLSSARKATLCESCSSGYFAQVGFVAAVACAGNHASGKKVIFPTVSSMTFSPVAKVAPWRVEYEFWTL